MWRKLPFIFDHIPASWTILTGILSWLVFVSVMHLVVYAEDSSRKVVTMGYMPVITNLAAPLLDKASQEGDGIRFRALKFSSFAEMAEALRNGQIDVAFMIAPLSIVLRQQGEDVKIVYIGNRHESTLVARKDLQVKTLDDLVGKTVAVPMRYSGHNISILNLLKSKGLNGKIKVVEMNPPDMASALTSGSLDAYYVGEPFAAKTLKSGDSTRLLYVEDVWKGFICNLGLVRKDLIDKEPELVSMMVSGAARSGIWAQNNPDEAAEVVAKYWNQPVELVKYALKTPENRIVYDEFTPKEKEMQHMADLMTELDLLKSNDVSGLVDDKFAKDVNLKNVTTLKSVLE